MKKFDLYDITLKIFGFYFLVTALVEAKQLVAFLISANMMGAMGGGFSPMSLVWPYILTIAIDCWLIWLFLFRTKKIIVSILPKSQSETVDFSINKPALVQVACIVVGGLVLVGAVEQTGRNLISLVQLAGTPFEVNPTAIPELIWQLVIGIGGYALIAGSSSIAQRFAGKTSLTKTDADKDARFHFGQWKISPTVFKKKRPRAPQRKKA